MEKLEKLMSRDIDGQKLGQQKKKLKSKHKFFFSARFSQEQSSEKLQRIMVRFS